MPEPGPAPAASRPPAGRVAHLCHVFPTFERGGRELRTVAIINALGGRFRHTIMALDGASEAAADLDPDLGVTFAPAPAGSRNILYALAMRAALRAIRPDLLITYNWGAIFGLIGGRLARVCPIVHAEDGFGADEAVALKWRRVLTRRFWLRTIEATVVPSRTLFEVARRRFGLPERSVLYIPNGVDLARFRPGRDLAWRRSRGIPDDAVLFGTVSGLRPVKQVGLLLRAFARADLAEARLAIVGDGPSRADWERLARQLGLGERVVFTGELVDPAPCYAAFDVFVMSSATEQMPSALLEAMASGLPAICTDVGDSTEMLGGRGWPSVVPPGDEAGYAAALSTLARRPELRAELGAANRARCVERYSFERMIGRYAALYDSAWRARA